MLIQIGNLKDGILREVEHTYDPSQLQVELVDLKFLAPLEMKGTIEKHDQALSFKGTLESRVKRICGRSCKELVEDLKIDFDLYLELGEEDSIDVTDEVREAVLIEQPMVYYAPDEDPSENAYNSESDEKKVFEKDENPFKALEKIRDRLKEE